MITLLPLRKTNRNKYFLAHAEIFSRGLSIMLLIWGGHQNLSMSFQQLLSLNVQIEPNNAFSLLKISVDLDEFYFILIFDRRLLLGQRSLLGLSWFCSCFRYFHSFIQCGLDTVYFMQRDNGAAKVKIRELALDSLMSKYGKKTFWMMCPSSQRWIASCDTVGEASEDIKEVHSLTCNGSEKYDDIVWQLIQIWV